MSLEGI